MSSIRIAVCQLRSHPALYTGHISYLEEPFVPLPGDPSLSRLGTKGIAVDSLHEYCLTAYTNWALTRLTAVLRHLSSFDPVPNVVIFPECGILISSLPVVSAWSEKNAATVLAGTHTPLGTASARQTYSAIGIGSGHVDRINRKDTISVLPLISAGKTKLVRKKGLAPAEFSLIDGQRREHPSIKAYPIQTSIGELQLAPIICAEALQQPNYLETSTSPLSFPTIAAPSSLIHSFPRQFITDTWSYTVTMAFLVDRTFSLLKTRGCPIGSATRCRKAYRQEIVC